MTGTGSMYCNPSPIINVQTCDIHSNVLLFLLSSLKRAVRMLSTPAVLLSSNKSCSFSFFMGEMEKCLDDPDHLGLLFVKHVSSFFPEVNSRTFCFFNAHIFMMFALVAGAEIAHVHCLLPKQTQI